MASEGRCGHRERAQHHAEKKRKRRRRMQDACALRSGARLPPRQHLADVGHQPPRDGPSPDYVTRRHQQLKLSDRAPAPRLQASLVYARELGTRSLGAHTPPASVSASRLHHRLRRTMAFAQRVLHLVLLALVGALLALPVCAQYIHRGWQPGLPSRLDGEPVVGAHYRKDAGWSPQGTGRSSVYGDTRAGGTPVPPPPSPSEPRPPRGPRNETVTERLMRVRTQRSSPGSPADRSRDRGLPSTAAGAHEGTPLV